MMLLLVEMMLLLVEMMLLLVEMIQLFLRYFRHQYCTREKLSSCYLGIVYQRYISKHSMHRVFILYYQKLKQLKLSLYPIPYT